MVRSSQLDVENVALNISRIQILKLESSFPFESLSGGRGVCCHFHSQKRNCLSSSCHNLDRNFIYAFKTGRLCGIT